MHYKIFELDNRFICNRIYQDFVKQVIAMRSSPDLIVRKAAVILGLMKLVLLISVMAIIIKKYPDQNVVVRINAGIEMALSCINYGLLVFGLYKCKAKKLKIFLGFWATLSFLQLIGLIYLLVLFATMVDEQYWGTIAILSLLVLEIHAKTAAIFALKFLLDLSYMGK